MARRGATRLTAHARFMYCRFAMRQTPTKKRKRRDTQLVQFTIERAEFRRVCAMAKRADLSMAAFIRAALITHARVEAELAAHSARERADAERRLIERARDATPDSFTSHVTTGRAA
jgi:hypothetical protein